MAYKQADIPLATPAPTSGADSCYSFFFERRVGLVLSPSQCFHSYLGSCARIQGFLVKSITRLPTAVQPAFSGLGYPAAKSRFGTIVMLISLAAALEVAQLWVPGRHSQFIDFATSAVGTCLGMLAAVVAHRVTLADLR
jgi:hypothetical protein